MELSPVQLTTLPLAEVAADYLAVFMPEQDALPAQLAELDQLLDGGLTKLRNRGDLTGKAGEVTILPLISGLSADRLMIVGLGKPETLKLTDIEKAVLLAVRKVAGRKEGSLAIDLSDPALAGLGTSSLVQTAACAAGYGATTPGVYKAENDRYPLKETLLVVEEQSTELAQAANTGRILGRAINLARELVNRHPEDIYPETFAARALEEARCHGIECEIWDQEKLKLEKMGSLLAVARGSDHEPRAVFMRYQGADEAAPTLAICGKGVTFDSGGLSLKPSTGMISMKADMAGAATALAAIIAIAELKLPVNVIVGIGLVENMVGPHSYKLGEVLTARNGKTIEVHNTDAEGRLVLADILSYVAEAKPKGLVDLATLTGACVVALGEDISGAFANNEDWCGEVLAAAKRAGEDVWPMPMFDFFDEQLKSDFADMKNVGTKWGGAITAAKFLERFVDGVPWVHLDIAGPSYGESPKPWRDVGGTGAMVRTLVELARSQADS
ncbi:MAG: leucyl aminopeptidase [Planctomycetaceae bacterium]|nr:leucyl aminopeptidase [Planctomycetaceae bacterium]